jgi:NAD(P)H dehydrogenase (quinone)
MKPRVLVTTGAGRTGSVAAVELRRRGFPVRVLVHRDDGRAARLREADIEVAVGNLYDWRDLREALLDVQHAYHCPPFDSRLLHGSTLFAAAAEDAGVEVVALMSAWNPHPSHPSIVQREHWLVNNLYRRFPFEVIHVTPGMFAFPYLLGLPAVVHLGLLALPFGQGLNAPPSNEDIGVLAARVLEDPAPYVGRCLRPTGPTLLSPDDVAGVLGDLLGRRVRYRDVSTRMFIKAARAQGYPIFQIAQVRHYAAELRAGAFADLTDHFEEVVGRAPEDFATIARRYLDEPWRVAPGLQAGSRARAITFALRLIATRAPNLDSWERGRDYPVISGGQLAHDDPDWVAAAARQQLLFQPEPSKQRVEARHTRARPHDVALGRHTKTNAGLADAD